VSNRGCPDWAETGRNLHPTGAQRKGMPFKSLSMVTRIQGISSISIFEWEVGAQQIAPRRFA
jgi:hypothetical protein